MGARSSPTRCVEHRVPRMRPTPSPRPSLSPGAGSTRFRLTMRFRGCMASRVASSRTNDGRPTAAFVWLNGCGRSYRLRFRPSIHRLRRTVRSWRPYGGLSADGQAVLLLAPWKQLEPNEMAQVLGVSRTAARSRLHRARRRLADRTAEDAERSP